MNTSEKVKQLFFEIELKKSQYTVYGEVRRRIEAVEQSSDQGIGVIFRQNLPALRRTVETAVHEYCRRSVQGEAGLRSAVSFIDGYLGLIPTEIALEDPELLQKMSDEMGYTSREEMVICVAEYLRHADLAQW